MSELSHNFGRSRDALQLRDAAGLRQFAPPGFGTLCRAKIASFYGVKNIPYKA